MAQKITLKALDYVPKAISLLGILGLVGLAGFIDHRLFALSSISFLSYIAYFRFFRIFFDPRVTIHRDRFPVLFISFVPILIINLGSLFFEHDLSEKFGFLGFLGFLGYLNFLLDKPPSSFATTQ